MTSVPAHPEVLNGFAKIVAKSLHIDPQSVTEEAYLDELGAESLDLIEITMEAEETFYIWMPEKSILQTAKEVFPPGILEIDGVLTENAKAMLRHRMPELDSKVFENHLTERDINKFFLRVGTWVRMIESQMAHTPRTCSQCGGEMEKVDVRMRCRGCGTEISLPSGEDLNRQWVQSYHDTHYAPEAGR